MFQARALALMEKEAKAEWSDPYPLALDDRPFKPTQQNTVFIRHSVVFGDGERTAIGTGWYRYMGLQYLSIFFQPGGGNASVYQKADEMMQYYTDKILSEESSSDALKINFQVASTIKLPVDAHGYNQVQVVCPFYFDSRS